MLVLTVVFTVGAADADGVADTLRGSLEERRKVPGSIAFDVVRVTDDPTTFILHETWADDAAYAAHRAKPNPERDALRALMKTHAVYAGTPLV